MLLFRNAVIASFVARPFLSSSRATTDGTDALLTCREDEISKRDGCLAFQREIRALGGIYIKMS